MIDGLPEDAPELVLSRLLDEYRDVREERLKGASARVRAAAGLLVVGLQQRLLSSIEAFALSLARHRKTVRTQWEQANENTNQSTSHSAERGSRRSGRIPFANPPDADDDRAEQTDEENHR